MTRVGLHHGGQWDYATVRSVLGVDPLEPTPWLRHVAARSFRNRATTTPTTRAQSLRGLLRYLSDRNVSLRGATHQRMASFQANPTGRSDQMSPIRAADPASLDDR